MRKTLLALLALVAVGAVVLLVVMREDDGGPTKSDAATDLPEPEASASASASASAPADGARPAVERVAVPDREREQAIRLKVNRILEGYPEVARVTDIRCTGPSCRVELEAVDLEKVAPVMERVAAPGQGFTEEARELRLERPVALGLDGGPYRMVFTLMF